MADKIWRFLTSPRQLLQKTRLTHYSVNWNAFDPVPYKHNWSGLVLIRIQIDPVPCKRGLRVYTCKWTWRLNKEFIFIISTHLKHWSPWNFFFRPQFSRLPPCGLPCALVPGKDAILNFKSKLEKFRLNFSSCAIKWRMRSSWHCSFNDEVWLIDCLRIFSYNIRSSHFQ